MTEALVQAGSTAMAAVQGEIDIQVSTARRYPRDLDRFRRSASDMVGRDPESAAACFYSLRRQGSLIEGPSARLAEIVASCWGNMRCQARILGEDGDFVVAEGVAWDMENNVLVSQQVRRRITTRDGQKFSADMIGVTANAAASIALRNAILRVVPRAYVDPLWRAAKSIAVGDAPSLRGAAAKAIEWFTKAGMPKDRILASLGVASEGDLTSDDIAHLRGLATAIREGTSTIEDAFPASAELPPAGRMSLGKRPRGRPRKNPEPAAAQPPPAPEPPHDETTGEVEPEHDYGPPAWDAPGE